MIRRLLILLFLLSSHIVSAQTGNTNTGTDALYWISTGDYNTITGYETGFYTSTGSGNTVDGYQAFYDNLLGSYNSIYGFQAGYYATGDSCVFLGMKAGYDETGSHKLYIENTDISTPLIYGEFDNDYLRFNGIVTIQTSGQILSGSDTLIDAGAVYAYIGGETDYFESELTDAQNNIDVGFTLASTSVVFFNGAAILNTKWSGEGTQIINLSLGTKLYDNLIVRK